MRFIHLVVAVCLALPLAAQRKDFLSADEIDQLRQVQEPNNRLWLYIQFAKQRVGMVEQLLTQEKPGRSALIHELLDQYTRIIDSIDTVADDALKRKLEIDKGMGYVAGEEKKLLESLQKIEESDPKDIARYQFVLEQAIETTQDSMELSSQDLANRAREVEAREVEADKKLEEMMQPKDLEQRRAEQKKEEEKKSKVPTLYRKGEQKKKQ